MQTNEELMQFFFMGELRGEALQKLEGKLCDDPLLAKRFAELSRIDSAISESFLKERQKDVTMDELEEDEDETPTVWIKIKSIFKE